MAMTSAVKDELARVELNKSCCRKAEVSALLRFCRRTSHRGRPRCG
jgi:cell division protein WhiA